MKQLDLDHGEAMKTLTAYGEACNRGDVFNPAVFGRPHRGGVHPPRTNWAQKLDAPPFYSYAATGGSTFTFGGTKIDRGAQALSIGRKPSGGICCAREMVGRLFHGNYALGTGLMPGAVFGRIAWRSPARS